MNRKKVVIITNEPAPYRVDHYKFLQKQYKKYEFHIIYSIEKTKSELRQWDDSTSGLKNVYFLPSYEVVMKRRYDNREIIITYGVGKVLKSIEPDVVVCMEYNPTSLMTMHWCRREKVPYISLTDGTLYSERNIGKFQKISRKYIMKYSSAFIASSTRAKEKIESYNVKKKIYVSFLSEDISKYLNNKRSAIRKEQIIYVGSLIERKGVDLLIRAYANLKSNCKLIIAGEGPLKKELIDLVYSLKLEDKIEFVGYKQRAELVELYSDSKLFVLPTREDCYGLVILEAMCASLPVVASKYADGAYDLIEVGVTGEIVDPYNEIEFAKCLDKVIQKNDADNEWGNNAYKRAKTFGFDIVSKEFITAIDDVLSERAEKEL